MEIPQVIVGSPNEAILFTYSAESHLEFVIRNTMIRLGPGWNHTIVCGVNNVSFLTDMCAKIDGDIRIVNTGHTSLTLPEYTRFMTTAAFWKIFTGSTLLLYQEDCCVFDAVPTDIMALDFVVSGGISIRKRQVMLDCIRKGSGKVKATTESDFYTQAIRRMGCGRDTTVKELGLFRAFTGFRIWEHDLCWRNRLLQLVGKRLDLNPNFRIYILCHTAERLESAEKIYGRYSWAYPVLMKYQDCSFENAFWPQLLELKDEWSACEFVGTLSWSAHKKINLGIINKHISEGYYSGREYVNFNDSGILVRKSGVKTAHPHFMEIWDDVTNRLEVDDVTENCCNYWICTPTLMERFIRWHAEICRPLVLKHPLIFTDAKYGGAMTPVELDKLWSMPYYPHVPFIMERLNKAFFDNTEKDWYAEKIEIAEEDGEFVIRPLGIAGQP